MCRWFLVGDPDSEEASLIVDAFANWICRKEIKSEYRFLGDWNPDSFPLPESGATVKSSEL